MKKAWLLVIVLMTTGMLYSGNSQDIAVSAKKKTWFGTSESWDLAFRSFVYITCGYKMCAILRNDIILLGENKDNLSKALLDIHLSTPELVLWTAVMKLVWDTESLKNECTVLKEQMKTTAP